jgi:hypothetical protein
MCEKHLSSGTRKTEYQEEIYRNARENAGEVEGTRKILRGKYLTSATSPCLPANSIFLSGRTKRCGWIRCGRKLF